MKPDILIISTNDWNGFWFQRQEFAGRFAADGHRVFYVNRIPQRIPKPGRIIRWLFARHQAVQMENPIPEGVYVFRPLLLPPFGLLRPINRLLWKRALRKISIEGPKHPVLITYQPTYNVLDLLPLLEPSRLVYVNTHNYDADPSCPKALLRSEALLARRADALLADAEWNRGRLERYEPAVPVERAMPGVSVEKFSRSYRGDEAEKRKIISFFGDIGRHLDVELYNQLADEFEIRFIGIADASVASALSPKITVLPPVIPEKLPEALREADILSIFYKASDYVNGIIPAKFFECLATGKPLFVSGLPETLAFGDVVYPVEGDADKARSFAAGLAESESDERKARRREVALGADWSARYIQFCEKAGIGS